MIAKVALNVDCNSWARKVIFYSISHKTALTFFYTYIWLKNIGFGSYIRRLLK